MLPQAHARKQVKEEGEDMPGFRCPNDQSHDTFRILVRRAQKVARFVDRVGRRKLDDETVLDSRDEVLEAVCAECGAVAVIVLDEGPQG